MTDDRGWNAVVKINRAVTDASEHTPNTSAGAERQGEGRNAPAGTTSTDHTGS